MIVFRKYISIYIRISDMYVYIKKGLKEYVVCTKALAECVIVFNWKNNCSSNYIRQGSLK